MNKLLSSISTFLILQLLIFTSALGAWVVSKGDKIYIKDQTGELWDVTQAQSLGFKPEKFQYGIGKNAFTPLSNSDLNDKGFAQNSRERVIGINSGTEAQAYSINRLRYHEIANTRIDNKAITVGYWPLVDLAAVYSRTLNGIELTLAPSGWTYKNTFVLYDKETESLWYPEGEGLRSISGSHFDSFLPGLESKDMGWHQWVDIYPDSKVLR